MTYDQWKLATPPEYEITPEEEAAMDADRKLDRTNTDAERVRDIVPVAWRWRWGRIGNTAWRLSLEKPGPFAEEGYEVEPLYTADNHNLK